MGLGAFLIHGGHDATEGGKAREEYWTEPGSTGVTNGIKQGLPLEAATVDIVDEDEGVVDDDTGKGKNTKGTHDAEGLIHDHMTEQGTHEAERDDGHDDEGLEVAAKGDGEHGVDAEQDENATKFEGGKRFAAFAALTLKAVGHAGIGGNDFGKLGLEASANFLEIEVGVFLVGIGEDVDGAGEVGVANRGVAFTNLCTGNGVERHGSTVWGADVHGLKAGEGFTLNERVTHHDANLVLAALNALGLVPEKATLNLAANLGAGEATLEGGGLKYRTDFLLATLKGVIDVEEAGIASEFFLYPLGGFLQGAG